MPTIRLSELTPDARAELLRQAALQNIKVESPQPAQLAKAGAETGAWEGVEKDLQRAVEDMLNSRGYSKRTTKILEAGGQPGCGWQIHIRRAVGNPYMLDILLLGKDGRYLEFELKTAKGQPTPLQVTILKSSRHKSVLRSVEAVEQLLNEWEGEAHGE